MKNPMKLHFVILAVDTVGLSNINYVPGKTDLNDYCQFVGQNPNDNIELFTTEVRPGDEIEWSGFSTSSTSNPKDTVAISDITHQTGKNLVGNVNSGGQGKKKCKIKGNYTKNNWEKYNLFFQINGTGTKYEIDPIINVYQ